MLHPARPRRAEVIPPKDLWGEGARSRFRGLGLFMGEMPINVFADEILTAPVIGDSPDEAEIADHRLRSALFAHYTGVEAEAAPRLPPKKVKRLSQKKSDGC